MEWLTFEQAAEKYGKTKFRIRALSLEKFSHDSKQMKKVTIKRGKGSYQRWEVNSNSLEKYFASIQTGDGRKYWMYRATAKENVQIDRLFAKLGIVREDRYKFHKKS